MMRIKWTAELPQLVILAAMFLTGMVAWPQVADRLPLHWTVEGKVDVYGGRLAGLFGTPLVAGLLYAAMLLMPHYDLPNRNYARFAKPYLAIRYALLGFLAIVHGVLLCGAFHVPIPTVTIVYVSAGILVMVIGMLMPQIGPNWVVGVRTPWTLSNDVAWEKTHRVAGWLLPLAGVGIASVGIIRTGWVLYTALTLATAATLWLAMYSYLVWRQETRRA